MLRTLGKSRILPSIILILALQSLYPLPAHSVVTTCVGSNCTHDFSYTGAIESWVVPTSGRYTIQAWGAQGGNLISAQAGGRGGYATGDVSLTAGTTIYISIGGQGASLPSGNGSSNPCTFTAGPFGGGGGTYNNGGGGTPGGGASDVRIGGTLFLHRVIVAGGGGGGGWNMAVGGVGGGTTGGTASSSGGGTFSQGGTQSAGGNSGTTSASCTRTAGSQGQGGNGSGSSAGGGGGGGGYFGGGGGGYADGGGGGSSFFGTLANGSTIAGNASMPNPAGGTMTGRNGDGFIRFTFSPPVSTSVSLTMASTNVSKGSTAQATATVTQAGKITFLSNGKRIPGCTSRTITSTLTCTFKPSTRGTISVAAILYPSSSAFLTSFSTPITISASPRGNRR